MIYVNEKDLVVPGELLAEDDYYWKNLFQTLRFSFFKE